MNYTYKMLTLTTYEVTATNYKSVFNGDENSAILQIKSMNDAYFNPLKVAKIKALQDKFQEQYDAYLASYPKAEVSSFNDKKNEAIAYNLDNTVPTPIIDSILVGLGMKKATYISGILAKVNFLAKQEGAMVKVRDAIKACTTQDELDAITI